jgi:hypothetical protein
MRDLMAIVADARPVVALAAADLERWRGGWCGRCQHDWFGNKGVGPACPIGELLAAGKSPAEVSRRQVSGAPQGVIEWVCSEFLEVGGGPRPRDAGPDPDQMGMFD